MTIYVVKNKDTVYSIAQKYGVSPELIISNNALKDPNRLVVGQTLVIGIPKVTHTVNKGDTLYSIARMYGTTVNELLRNNPKLMGGNTIIPDEELVIEYEGDKKRCILTNGYAYPSISDMTLEKTLPSLSNITPFAYGFNADGSLVTLSDDRIIEMSKDKGTSPIMLLTTLNSEGKFDNNMSSLLLNDEDMQNELIQNILDNMRIKGYRILDVDFEFVFPEEREEYAEFLKRVKEAFAPYGYQVWVALAPKTSGTQRGLLYEAHDYGLLGSIVDKVLLMTYEWGYTYSEAMAVAPINKVREVVDYALTEIPPEKILLGVPNYGYDFTNPYVEGVSKATTVSNIGAVELARDNNAAIEFDEVSMSPFFKYYKNGVEHEVWFEDARSIQAKLDLMDEKGLSGFSVWNLMNFFPQLWLLTSPYCID